MVAITCLSAMMLAGTLFAGCGNPQAATDNTPSAASPGDGTPAATPAPMTPPSQLSAPGSLATPMSVEPLTPGAAGVRTDCPAETSPYASRTGRLSFCVDSNAVVVTSEIDANNEERFIATTRNTDGVPDPGLPDFVVGVQIAADPPLNLNIPLAEVCTSGGHKEGTVATITISALRLQGCHWIEEQNNPLGPLESTLVTAPLENGQFLNVEANWRSQSDGAKEAALQVAEAIEIHP